MKSMVNGQALYNQELCNAFQLVKNDPGTLQPRLNKMVLLCLEAYNSGLEAGIGTCRDIVGFLRISAFI